MFKVFITYAKRRMLIFMNFFDPILIQSVRNRASEVQTYLKETFQKCKQKCVFSTLVASIVYNFKLQLLILPVDQNAGALPRQT